MPLYEFVCQKCQYQFEELVLSASKAGGVKCPECNGSVKKQLSVFAAHTNVGSGPCGNSAKACQMAPDGDCSGGGCPFSK